MENQSKNSSLAGFVFEMALRNMPNRDNLWKVFVFIFLLLLSFVIGIISVSFSVLLFFLRVFSLVLMFGGVIDFVKSVREN